MARKRYAIPQYGTVIMAGKEYYRTRIEDADGKRVALIRNWRHWNKSTMPHSGANPPQ